MHSLYRVVAEASQCVLSAVKLMETVGTSTKMFIILYIIAVHVCID